MENVNNMLMIGFSAVLFAAALAVTIIMYVQNDSFMKEVERNNSFRVVMAGD